jgi:predicted nucleotidyltransferase
MSLFEELIEDKELDDKIVKSFKSKETLSDQIFDGEKGEFKMREDIRKKLLEISDNFIESLGVEFFIHDIVLTGSLANYNWSDFSDVDLHILIDFDEIDGSSKKDSTGVHSIIKEFFDAKKNVWNDTHNIVIKGYDVELYVQDVNEEHISSGVYSILNNEWLVNPEKTEPNIDDRIIIEKGSEYGDKIDKLIQSASKGVDVLNKIDELRKKLKKFRQSGLDSGGEYSYENLTFKLLRRNGYIEKLLKLKTDITDKKLSITQ